MGRPQACGGPVFLGGLIGGGGVGRKDVEREVEAMARQVAGGLGLTVVDVELFQRGRKTLLRVVLDRPGGIQLEECARASEELSQMLDAADPLPGPYVLEVTSPGLDRVLRRDEEYELFRGRQVAVRTYAPVEGKRLLEGVLLGLRDQDVVLEVEGREVRIPRQQVAKAHLVAEF